MPSARAAGATAGSRRRVRGGRWDGAVSAARVGRGEALARAHPLPRRRVTLSYVNPNAPSTQPPYQRVGCRPCLITILFLLPGRFMLFMAVASLPGFPMVGFTSELTPRGPAIQALQSIVPCCNPTHASGREGTLQWRFAARFPPCRWCGRPPRFGRRGVISGWIRLRGADSPRQLPAGARYCKPLAAAISGTGLELSWQIAVTAAEQR